MGPACAGRGGAPGGGESLTLGPGDYVFLPAGMPHAVERVSDGAVWLAVHLHPDGAAGPG